MKTFTSFKPWIISATLLCALAGKAQAQAPLSDPTNCFLNSWCFYDTNTWCSDLGHAALSCTNLNASLLGDGSAVVLDSTNAAWLQYNVIENDGTTNLTVDQGSLTAGGVFTWIRRARTFFLPRRPMTARKRFIFPRPSPSRPIAGT